MGQIRIKICGITRHEDALEAARLGADALGFNFYTGSPRHTAPAVAADIIRALPPWIDPVALFVNESLTAIRESLVSLGPVRTIQWHGDDPPICTDTSLRFIPAFQIRDQTDLQRVDAYLTKCGAHPPAALLLDGHRADVYGGSGRQAPWTLLRDFHPPVPIILAGGLTPDNVAEAVRTVRPYGVDVAGGVESEPGKKERDKLRHFIEQARDAAAGL